MTPTYVAVIAEFTVAIINGIALLIYYGFKQRAEIAIFQCVFGILLIINTTITLAINISPVTECAVWYMQGISFNVAEALVDWIFLIRVYKLEQKWWKKVVWQLLYWGLDIIPRIVSVILYSTRYNDDGVCLLSLPSTARIVKSVLNTIFVGIVGVFFVSIMVASIRQSHFSETTQKLESLKLTSAMFGILLCVVRTVTYIPYILNTFGPVWTGVLIPIEMIILPPLIFLSIVYGARLKTGSSANSKVMSVGSPSEFNSFNGGRMNSVSSVVSVSSPSEFNAYNAPKKPKLVILKDQI
ncbi:hypothetical protein HDV01_007734 [Terramyces sp. JEL0728]|nr:hypothetical protein HDV01_007734 [Terramyces sp. JEL0728]